MEIRFLGGFGGTSLGHQTTSFLIDNKILIDAGSVASTLSIEEQLKIKHVFISHSHLDHIKDLAFLADNCFGLKPEAFKVFSHQSTIKNIKDHLFNDLIWPDFSRLPSEDHPTVSFHPIDSHQRLVVDGYEITPIPVHHMNGSLGFLVRQNQKSVFFTLDTGPSNETWDHLKKYVTELDLIVTEVSFPNQLSQVAEVSFHHTPASLKTEIKKMPPFKKLILTHLKPHYENQIKNEILEYGIKNIHILEADGYVVSI